jgi:hypothetical protein
MDFLLDPPSGIGPLRRGMTRAEALTVLATWGEPRETLDLLDIMRPGGMSIVAIVGAAGRVDTIELHRPDADDTNDTVRYRDVDLFGLRAPEVIDRLREHTRVDLDPDEPDCFAAPDLALALGEPDEVDDRFAYVVLG